jgi:preprotein translocase subunit SecD
MMIDAPAAQPQESMPANVITASTSAGIRPVAVSNEEKKAMQVRVSELKKEVEKNRSTSSEQCIARLEAAIKDGVRDPNMDKNTGRIEPEAPKIIDPTAIGRTTMKPKTRAPRTNAQGVTNAPQPQAQVVASAPIPQVGGYEQIE